MNIRTATINGIPKELRIRDAARNGQPAASPETVELSARVDKVVAVAAAHAAAVDSESRFPKEAITAARAERLLGVAVPREFGGDGLSVADVTDICYALGRACASTAMIHLCLDYGRQGGGHPDRPADGLSSGDHCGR